MVPEMSRIPAVSIVMPVYNAEKFLHQAIQSVFAQTLDDWELIAVDDASIDGSFEYLQRISDPRVRVVRNDHNMRHPATVNRGNDLARSKWVARMDADDIILPTRIEKQVEALEANPEVDALGCGTFMTDVDLKPILVQRCVTSNREIKRTPTLFYPVNYGSLVAKSAWWKRWRLDPKAVEQTSFDLFFRSHRETFFSNIPDPLYIYRFAGNTRSVKKLTINVCHRARTLLLHGFRMGMPFQTMFGLALLVPRPPLYLIKAAIGSFTPILSARGQSTNISKKDLDFLRAGLVKVADTEVPLKSNK
jgi:glycosyltransferase involved in cell wall biosynthesis